MLLWPSCSLQILMRFQNFLDSFNLCQNLRNIFSQNHNFSFCSLHPLSHRIKKRASYKTTIIFLLPHFNLYHTKFKNVIFTKPLLSLVISAFVTHYWKMFLSLNHNDFFPCSLQPLSNTTKKCSFHKILNMKKQKIKVKFKFNQNWCIFEFQHVFFPIYCIHLVSCTLFGLLAEHGVYALNSTNFTYVSPNWRPLYSMVQTSKS